MSRLGGSGHGGVSGLGDACWCAARRGTACGSAGANGARLGVSEAIGRGWACGSVVGRVSACSDEVRPVGTWRASRGFAVQSMLGLVGGERW